VAAGLNMMSLHRRCGEEPAARKLCGEIEHCLNEATKELRTHAYLLNPPQLEKDGLKSSVHHYVDGFSRRTGLEIKLNISPQVNHLPLPNQRALLRVVQEALANVHRHASASEVSITIRSVADRIHLVVSDNGKGIEGAERLGARRLDAARPCLPGRVTLRRLIRLRLPPPLSTRMGSSRGVMATDKSVGSAEAMRRSMLAMIEVGGPDVAFRQQLAEVPWRGAAPTSETANRAPGLPGAGRVRHRCDNTPRPKCRS
jgi:hypothetical protein